MNQHLAPWLRRGALAVAALALFAGVAPRAQAGPIVGVYEKSGFDYVVNLGDSTSLSSISINANIPEFGGSTAGAMFAIVGVLNRTMVDSSLLPVGNVIFSTSAIPTTLPDTSIQSGQALVAGFGTADSWFDLIPAVTGGGVGAHATIAATADNSFEKKVDNTFFNALPFSMAGTIDANGNLNFALYSAIASDDFNEPPFPQSISKLYNVHVTSTGITAPEPASLVLIGLALAATATIRRRTV
jgi:hypothetical protein